MPNPVDTFTVATINGFLNLGNGNIAVDPVAYNPGQIALALNAAITASSITKTGNGVLGIGGVSPSFTRAVNLNGGTLASSAGGVLIGGQVTIGSGTTLDTRGLSGTIGSLASTFSSAVVMNGLQGAGATLTTGLDNTSASFAGVFNSPYPQGQLGVTKIGSGTQTLTGNSSATNSGTLTINGGTVDLNAGGLVGFSTDTINTNGTLLLDNTATAVNNRLGSATLASSLATLAPTLRSLNFGGGSLIVDGNNVITINEGLGTVSFLGGGVITLNAAGTSGINVAIANLGGQNQPTSLLIRGDGLGQAAGPGVATLAIANPAFQANQGGHRQWHDHDVDPPGYHCRFFGDRPWDRLPDPG